MTSEQAKILGIGMGAMTAPFLAHAYQQWGASEDLASGAIAAWGGVLVVLLTVFIGGKPDTRAAEARVEERNRVADQLERTYPELREVASDVRKSV
jgi:hypothetical protein